MNRLLICLFPISLLLVGCVSTVDRQSETIRIDVSKETVLSVASLFERVDTMSLDCGEEIVGQLTDMCVSAHRVMLLDAGQNLFSFDRHTGVLVKKINLTGRGHGECINPVALTSAGDSLYILDLGGMKVSVFHSDLQFVRQFRLPCASLDMARLPNGFLFYNPDANTTMKSLVRTDDNGQVLDTYLDSPMKPDMMLGRQVFMEDGYGNVFCSFPMSNDVYQVSGTDFRTAFCLDFGQKRKSYSKTSKQLKYQPVNAICSFVLRGMAITLYLHDGVVKTNFYNRETHSSYCGIVDTCMGYPFTPMASSDSSLVAVHDMVENEVTALSRLLFVEYKLKENNR